MSAEALELKEADPGPCCATNKLFLQKKNEPLGSQFLHL